MFYPPRNRYDLNFYYSLDKRIIAKVHKFFEKYVNAKVIDAWCQPYICTNCGKIETKIDFEISAGDEVCKPVYICNCGCEFTPLTNEMQYALPCIKCGAKMDRTITTIWD